jgi:uncharacterized protein YaiI (UPF0178 family)
VVVDITIIIANISTFFIVFPSCVASCTLHYYSIVRLFVTMPSAAKLDKSESAMKILVDADACPVRALILKVAKNCNLPVVLVFDTSHDIEDTYAEMVVVGRGRDAVDFALINRTEKGDIVVTQDYGVAAMALAKQACALNHNGLRYTADNMDALLEERHRAQKARRSGKRTGGFKKRSSDDDLSFEAALRALCPKGQSTGTPSLK